MPEPNETDDLVKQVFDTFTDEFFATRGKPSQDAYECLFMAMMIQASKSKEPVDGPSK